MLFCRREKEESERRAKEESEKKRIDLEEKLRKEEEERMARKKRIEEIMARTRGAKSSPTATPQSPVKANEAPVKNNVRFFLFFDGRCRLNFTAINILRGDSNSRQVFF